MCVENTGWPDKRPAIDECNMIVHHAVDSGQPDLPELLGSNQAALRHPELTVYRCFLPDLTGFTGLRRVEPGFQRRPTRQTRMSHA